MVDVSVLLGHSSVQTTERYYARRDARRERLRAVIAAAHSLDPVLTALAQDSHRGAGTVRAIPADRPDTRCIDPSARLGCSE